MSLILFLMFIPFCAFSEELKSEKPKIGSFATEPMGVGSIVEVLIGLAVVLLVFVAMTWFMRRLGGVGSQAGGSMKVLGAMSVGTRERVVLVKVGEEQILLGVAPGRVQALHKLEKPITDDSSSDEMVRFSDRLKTALKGGKQT